MLICVELPALCCLYRGRFDVWSTRPHKSPTPDSNRFCVYGVGSKTLLTTARQRSQTLWRRKLRENAKCPRAASGCFWMPHGAGVLLCGYAGCASSTVASCCSSRPCVWLSSALWLSASFSAAFLFCEASIAGSPSESYSSKATKFDGQTKHN